MTTLRTSLGRYTFKIRMARCPELVPRFCQRCEIKYSAIPRYRDTDHCLWCQEEIERGGRMVIGAGLEEAAGWIQIPENVMDESTDKEEHNRRYREKRRTGRCLNCGKPVDARSPRCASCATMKRYKVRLSKKFETA